MDVVPAALRDRPQWVCWRERTRDENVTKVPVDPRTGQLASSTDDETWDTFEAAIAYAESGEAAGVGYVFTADGPFVGVDLDDCRDPEMGEVADWATTIIDRLDSYTEVSPSGTGFHVLVEGTLPDGRSRHGNVEMYETARFFTVTGDRIDDNAGIQARPDALAAVHQEFVQPDDAPDVDGGAKGESLDSSAFGPGEEERAIDLDDETLLARARDAANGEKFTRLWRGETTAYDSHSEADMALCLLLAFWTGGDAPRVDRLFRDSGLMRDKWDEQHYADGRTYGEVTVQRAIDHVNDYYEPSDGDGGIDTVGSRRDLAESHVPERESPTAADGAEANPGTQMDARKMAQPRMSHEPDHGTSAGASTNVSALTARLETLEVEVRRLRDELQAERDRRTELEHRLLAVVETDVPTSSADQTTSPSLWQRVRSLFD